MKSRAMLAVVLSLACACTRGAAQPSLAPMTLPDLSAAAPPVQEKIRARYDAAVRARSASTYGELGKLLFAAEYLDAADTALANARILAPADVRWPYYLAHVARFRHDPARAADLFRAVLAIQPSNITAAAWAAEMELAQGHTDAAADLFERTLALDAQSAAARSGLGRIAIARRDYRGAVDHLEAALRLAPGATRLHYPLALAYRALGDNARADAALERRGEGDVTPADPLMAELGALLDNAPAHERRGAAALEQQQWGAAVSELRQAIALAPDHPYARLNLGTALYMAGDRDGAIEQFRSAVQLAPSLANAHYSLGLALAAGGSDGEAIDELEAAVAADRGFVQAHLDLANALRRAGRLEASLAEYSAVLDARPDEPAARFGYAMALVRLRRYRAARDWLAQSLRRAPEPGLTHALARLFAAAPDAGVRDGAQALAIVNQLAVGNRSAMLGETMAMALAEVGRFKDAVQLQQQLVAGATAAGQQAMAHRLQQNLERYRRGEACRTPWPDDDPVFYPRPADTPPAAPAAAR